MTNGNPRVLSGIQPSGSLHIGNYIGAISQWVAEQHRCDNFFCVADLHSLTVPEAINPEELSARSKEVGALYVACGIDPEKSTIFLQSSMLIHTYLSWILTCCTPLGWLERSTQFKSKTDQRRTIGTGLLTYPILQAADILAYQVDYVPVGDDQTQHVEITRDIAQRFNGLFGKVFKLPKPQVRTHGARIMGFDNPLEKMSKSLSANSEYHAVGLLDDPDKVKKCVMAAVTDSKQLVCFENGSPGVRNLLMTYASLADLDVGSVAEMFGNSGYGKLKKDLVELINTKLAPIQQRYREITKEGTVDEIFSKGAERANSVASETIKRVNEAVGIDGLRFLP